MPDMGLSRAKERLAQAIQNHEAGLTDPSIRTQSLSDALRALAGKHSDPASADLFTALGVEGSTFGDLVAGVPANEGN